MIKKYSGENLKELKGIYLIDFYADWCGPCKMLGHVLDTLEEVNIIKINVDEEEALANDYCALTNDNIVALLGFSFKHLNHLIFNNTIIS